MLVLGIDTATRVASVGLLRAAPDTGSIPGPEPGRIAEGCATLAEASRDSGLAHGAELLALIDECLAAAGIGLEEVGCIAVSSGPGSFTGLRVALATGKGLALAGGVALVGVPTLEAFASTVLTGWGNAAAAAPPADALIVPCLDARKGEVYSALFATREPVWSASNPRLHRLSPDVARTPDALSAELRTSLDAGRQVVLLGDGPERYREQLLDPLGGRAHALPFDRHRPCGATVARLGAGLFAAGGGRDLASVVPQYARASEAGIVRARRDGSSKPR